MKQLEVSFVIRLHDMLIEKSGGSKGLRDKGLLMSSLESAFQTYDGKALYPEDLDKIVHTSYSLIQNHCFVDGNKRIGILVLVILLKECGYPICWTNAQLVALGLAIANGEMSKNDFQRYIETLCL